MHLRLLIALAALLMVIACGSPDEAGPATAALPAATAVAETPATPETAAKPKPTAAPPTTAAAVPTPSAETLIMLRDPLDEPEYYCVDVAGFGSNLNLDSPLQAHTCKPGADDELFIFNYPAPGQFYMEPYDVCLEAGDGALYVRACSDAPNQRFALSADGAIQAQGTDLCLAVPAGDGEPAGGRSHLRRDLLLQPCADAAPNLSRWLLPGPSP